MAAFLQSLADALNISEAEARSALGAFADRLRTQVREQGRITYGGLGTFEQQGNHLTFTPDESVALVVNHRYAGMEPIPLSAGLPPTWQPGVPDDEHPLGPPPPEVFEDAAFEEVEAPETEAAPEPEVLPVEEAPEPDVENEPEADEPAWADVPPPSSTPDLPPLFASDETLMALRDAAREMEAAPPSEEADEWAARMIEEEAIPEEEDPLPPPPISPELMPAEARMEMPEAYEVVPDAEEDSAEEALPTEEAGPPDTPAEPVAVVPPIPPAAPPRSRERIVGPPERRFPWVPAILLLVLVGIVVAVLLMRQPAPAVPEQPAAPPVANTDTVLTPDTALTAATPAETTATAADAPAEPAPEPDGDLRGTAPVVAGRGYTIVVGGGTQAQAASLAESFQQQGYRVGVLAGRTDAGGTIYRAGVGQFSSLGEAQAALRRVPTLPSGAWILNLSSSLVSAE